MNLGTETDLQPVPFRYFLDETGRGEGRERERERRMVGKTCRVHGNAKRHVRSKDRSPIISSTRRLRTLSSITLWWFHLLSFYRPNVDHDPRSMRARERNKIENKPQKKKNIFVRTSFRFWSKNGFSIQIKQIARVSTTRIYVYILKISLKRGWKILSFNLE